MKRLALIFIVIAAMSACKQENENIITRSDITLAYNGTLPVDLRIIFTVNGERIDGDTFVMPFENVTVGIEYGLTGVPIDSINFPDENFRNWLLANSYGSDGLLILLRDFKY